MKSGGRTESHILRLSVVNSQLTFEDKGDRVQGTSSVFGEVLPRLSHIYLPMNLKTGT